jgi:Xaa-Pro aminopeptidase
MKARKNATEIAQMQQANLKASRAKIRTIKWVQDQVKAGKSVTEAEVAATIEGFYAAEEGFQGLSFNTIAGSGANSSIVHYGTPNPEAMVRLGDLLLLDSGAQFTGGTTDDTRTIVIGEPTPSQITRYTAVLKAHINCAMQQFPKGTTGAQLDGITRSTLWFANLDYGHGTGHGVGAFLNVHEGPNGISKRAHKPLESGMVNSIEPGYYEPGWGGIRIENLYVVRELPSEGDRPSQLVWYGFESLTHIPFDRTLIDLAQLDARQRDWLVAYYQAILTHVLPTLSPEDADWLQQACTL